MCVLEGYTTVANRIAHMCVCCSTEDTSYNIIKISYGVQHIQDSLKFLGRFQNKTFET